jgi:GT2 family glycosyltransferase
MNKNILILCVTYNSNKELLNYLNSINNALNYSPNIFNVDVFIADNNPENNIIINFKNYVNLNIDYCLNNINLGYLGGVTNLINTKLGTKVFNYDFLLISNVDLLLSVDFFSSLSNLKLDPLTAWIAPSIFSNNEKRDKNPKIISRPSKYKFSFYITKYRFPLINYIYEKSFYRLKYLKKAHKNKLEIYAGHGSFMIFTNLFISEIKNMNFPSFLFGEEIYLAELVLKSNYKVIYEPLLKIYDIEHASTSKLNYITFCKSNFDSLLKLKSIFYE